uniref:Uncharacterized protein n=1 Tax=Oryza meridionalis TaxID=40149 RepID=A0A0E0E1N9_9ORYZ
MALNSYDESAKYPILPNVHRVVNALPSIPGILRKTAKIPVINYLLRGWLKNVESEGSVGVPFLEEPRYAENGVSRELEFVRGGSKKSVHVRLFGSKISLWSQLRSLLKSNTWVISR